MSCPASLIRLHIATAVQYPMVTHGSTSWAAAVLLSRSFGLDMSEVDLGIEGDLSYYGSWHQHSPDVVALVPWADLMAARGEEAAGAWYRVACTRGE